ncbi:MAG: acylphosphatase [Deltaproteobacteria bacterium]|nr:acylphosphatase [Deltaproteobacteria bacterium]NCP02640.1 acylphosphatase [Deltaproteobacteria bacterium]
MSKVGRHLLISGRVQGVCFRHSTRKTALQNGVTGWVRNLPDGRVEAWLEGEEPAIDATLRWCYQGPEMARVDDVQMEEKPASGEFDDFSIR